MGCGLPLDGAFLGQRQAWAQSKVGAAGVRGERTGEVLGPASRPGSTLSPLSLPVPPKGRRLSHRSVAVFPWLPGQPMRELEETLGAAPAGRTVSLASPQLRLADSPPPWGLMRLGVGAVLSVASSPLTRRRVAMAGEAFPLAGLLLDSRLHSLFPAPRGSRLKQSPSQTLLPKQEKPLCILSGSWIHLLTPCPDRLAPGAQVPRLLLVLLSGSTSFCSRWQGHFSSSTPSKLSATRNTEPLCPGRCCLGWFAALLLLGICSVFPGSS